MAHYPIVFPRYQEDVESKRRTLFHLPESDTGRPNVSDEMVITPHENFPRGKAAVVTDVSLVELASLPDADLEKLGGVSREEYFQRWNALFPDNQLPSNPKVWRVEFSYGRLPSDTP